MGLILWLGCDQELAWCDPLADAAHLASLMEDLEAWTLSLSSLGHLPEDLLCVDWGLLWRRPVLGSPIERTVRCVVLTSHSEDAAG